MSIRKRLARMIWRSSDLDSEECKRGRGQRKPKTLSRIYGPDEDVEDVSRGGFGGTRYRN